MTGLRGRVVEKQVRSTRAGALAQGDSFVGVEPQVLRFAQDDSFVVGLVSQDDRFMVVEPQVLRFAQDDSFVVGLVAQDDRFMGGKASPFDAGWGGGLVGESPGLKPFFGGVGTVA